MEMICLFSENMSALQFNAVIGNVQEKAMREYCANNIDVIEYSIPIELDSIIGFNNKR